MLRVAVFSLLLITSLAVHVEVAHGVGDPEKEAILVAFADAIKKSSARDTSFDRVSAGCETQESCARAIAARTKADDIIFVRLIGAASRIRFTATVYSSASLAETRREELDLPWARDGWSPLLDQLALELFPRVIERPAIVAQPAIAPVIAPATPKEEARIAPWLIAGGGAVAAIVGSGFGLSSRGARNEANERALSEAEFTSLEDRAIGHGIAANVLMTTGLIAIAGGVVWYFVE